MSRISTPVELLDTGQRVGSSPRAFGYTGTLLAIPRGMLLLAVLADKTLPRLGETAGPDLGRHLLVCAILSISIGLVALGFRRLVSGTLRTRGAKRPLSVLDVLPLGGRQRLCVVRCYGRTFALGLGEKEVSLVAELDGVAARTRENEGAPRDVDPEAFVRLLDDARSAFRRRPPRVRELLQDEGALGSAVVRMES